MTKEALPTNSFSKEVLSGTGSAGEFDSGRFDLAGFETIGQVLGKVALPTNTLTKEAL